MRGTRAKEIRHLIKESGRKFAILFDGGKRINEYRQYKKLISGRGWAEILRRYETNTPHTNS